MSCLGLYYKCNHSLDHHNEVEDIKIYSVLNACANYNLFFDLKSKSFASDENQYQYGCLKNAVKKIAIQVSNIQKCYMILTG